MTPEQMTERLTEWAATTRHIEDCGGGSLAVHELPDRRADCVEPEGERRTWVLTEGGRQCGHVRMRATPTPRRVTAESGLAWVPTRTEIVSVDEWTVEASDRTRKLLGLDDAPEPGQTGSHG